MLGRMLRLDGFEVASFGSGEEFLASLSGRVPACVILDVHMPGLSGFDVRSRLCAMDARIPAIIHRGERRSRPCTKVQCSRHDPRPMIRFTEPRLE